MTADRPLPIPAPHPALAQAVWVHPTVAAFGNIAIGEGASFWPYTVIRAETGQARIGRMTNIQDFVMIHVDFRA